MIIEWVAEVSLLTVVGVLYRKKPPKAEEYECFSVACSVMPYRQKAPRGLPAAPLCKRRGRLFAASGGQ